MARKLRVDFPGAVYHVMSRGDHQEAIYRDDDHYFESVSTYIHMNPVRSGLVSAKPGALAGLKAFGLVKKDLGKMPKGAPEKLVLAWWLKGSTTVSRQWISAHLAMGHPTRVTSAGRAVQGANGGPLAKMRRHLENLEL